MITYGTLQVTPEGLNAMLYYRKATLQLFAIPVDKPNQVNMLDWVTGAGGPAFVDIIRHIARDARGLETMLDIVRLSASAPLVDDPLQSPCVSRLWLLCRMGPGRDPATCLPSLGCDVPHACSVGKVCCGMGWRVMTHCTVP